jgi:hypothetical protein
LISRRKDEKTRYFAIGVVLAARSELADLIEAENGSSLFPIYLPIALQ